MTITPCYFIYSTSLSLSSKYQTNTNTFYDWLSGTIMIGVYLFFRNVICLVVLINHSSCSIVGGGGHDVTVTSAQFYITILLSSCFPTQDLSILFYVKYSPLLNMDSSAVPCYLRNVDLSHFLWNFVTFTVTRCLLQEIFFKLSL